MKMKEAAVTKRQRQTAPFDFLSAASSSIRVHEHSKLCHRNICCTLHHTLTDKTLCAEQYFKHTFTLIIALIPKNVIQLIFIYPD